MPLGTLVINVTGSFLLGLLTALTVGHAGLADLQTVLGVGLLGGYTTFSAASWKRSTCPWPTDPARWSWLPGTPAGCCWRAWPRRGWACGLGERTIRRDRRGPPDHPVARAGHVALTG